MPTDDRPSPADVVVAVVVCLVVGARVPLQQALTLGIAVPVVLLPVLWRTLRKYPISLWLLMIGVVALGAGSILTMYLAQNHITSTSLMQINSLTLFSVLIGIAGLLWAFTVLRHRAAVWYAVGLLVGIVFNHDGKDNLWKYVLSVPVTLLCLSLAALIRRRSVELLVLLGLAVVCAAFDSRSAASMLIMAAALVAWQGVQQSLRLTSTTLRTLVTLTLFGTGLFFTMQALLLDGFLGADAEQRTLAQIQTSGSLIAGGRPEIGASTALIAHHPFGFGSGTFPTLSDITVAKTGMAALNYLPNNGYVENYLFGNGYEVHSVLGDLWIRFGPMGLVFGVACLVVVVGGAARLVAMRHASALMLYLAVQVFWDGLFSPLFATSISTLVLGVALSIYSTPAPGARRRGSSSSDRTDSLGGTAWFVGAQGRMSMRGFGEASVVPNHLPELAAGRTVGSRSELLSGGRRSPARRPEAGREFRV